VSIFADLPLTEFTLPVLLRRQAARLGDKPYLWFGNRTWSYEEADRLSDRLAAGLQRIGVAKGSHVGILMGNHPAMVWTLFALAKLGALGVLINTAAKGEQLNYFLTQSDSRFLIADEELLPRAFEAYGDTADRLVTICNGDSAIADHLLADLFVDAEPVIADPPRFSDNQVMMYTSGTTGPSKGVLCTFAQAVGAARDIATVHGYTEADTLFTCLPLFHANAFRATMTSALWSGATFALSQRFSARNFWREIRQSGATEFNGLGAMLSILLKLDPSEDERNHRLKLCCIAPSLSPEDTATVERRFRLEVTALYGSTEIGVPLYTGRGVPAEKWPSCGRAIAPFEMKVVDDNGIEVPDGTPGELVCRPRDPGIGFSGYYKMPQATAQTNHDYWFHTGDRGTRDAEGYFYFIDRKKESIRRRGENVSSFEVESIIARNEAVSEVAVIPVPSPLGEDDIAAFVLRKAGALLCEAEVIAHCQTNMAYFMIPRFVLFVDEMPKNSSEKIEKYKLRQIYDARAGLCWDAERAGIKLAR
jgi:carnitine-CoA ligase